MYFPYLRGRQFDLIACRELVEGGLLSERIIPIIEPVKASSTLRSTLDTFRENQQEIIVIQNPEVGEYLVELAQLSEEEREEFRSLMCSEFIIPAFLMPTNHQVEASIESFRQTYYDINFEDIVIIHQDASTIDNHVELFSEQHPRYTFTPDHSAFRGRIRHNRVLFEDRFIPERRNADYKYRDIFFSNDHLYYIEDQCVGFSDFSIGGNSYTDGGFAPFAVAFHLVYFVENEDIYVKSFVSDSNNDIQNPAGKYHEALAELFEWGYRGDPRIQTTALQVFIEHYQTGAYPGLGTVKKLSIMHHLEMMGENLSAGELP